MREYRRRRRISAFGDQLPIGYATLLEDIKTRIRTTQIKASLSVNRELIKLYWYIGKAVVERQQQYRWGNAVIEQLAIDIQNSFPGQRGFSRTNIYRMRAFYLVHSHPLRSFPQTVGQIDDTNVPQAVGEIPWGHNIILIEKIKDPARRIWYAQQTISHGWSRSMLVHQIESTAHSRQGKAITNFKATLPPPQSDLANQILKDPYNFDFLSLSEDARERDLELGLLAHIRRFLLELGSGFAFVGQQVHLEVGGEDFYIDLLFYHLRLRCYVVIELKVDTFKPEFAGKMNFYLSAVDELLRHPEDRQSVGIILCKTRNKIIAEYALRDVSKPVGVSSYTVKSIGALPADYRRSLPTTQALESVLKRAEQTEQRAKKQRHRKDDPR